MLQGYRIIDVDGHIQEPPDLWDHWLEQEFRAEAPKMVDGKRFYRGQESSFKLSDSVRDAFGRKTREYYQEYIDAGWSPDAQVTALDRMGIDISYLYPTQGLFLWHFRDMDPRMATALTRAYNNWLFDFCQTEPNRLKPVAALALQDPAEAVAELRRVRKEHGTTAVYIRPNPVDGRALNHPDLEPLWAECEAEGVAVGIHEGAHAPMATTGQDRFETDFALWSCSHPMEQMMAFLALLEGGVLERHPSLRFGFLEAGCGWVPYWLWRLDQRFENVSFEVAGSVNMKPSEYFHRQCYVSVEADEPYLGDIVQHIGVDRIVFASDFPHPDHKPDLTDEIVGLERSLSPPVLRKILWDNPSVFYGLA